MISICIFESTATIVSSSVAARSEVRAVEAATDHSAISADDAQMKGNT